MSPRRPSIRPSFVALIVSVVMTSPAVAQEKKAAGSDREQADELLRDHRALEALPVLEKIVKEHPEDRAMQEGLAEALVSQSAVVPEEEALAILKRVRAILLKLEETGELSPLSQIYLEQIPPDGKYPQFSRNKEVARALREAEAAFARNEFAKARDGYGRALTLDPKHYHAMLFTGDTYFAEKQPARAVVWFAKAAALDPDKAAAFRYWGDALRDLGKMSEARDRYVDGIIAEPYTRAPWLSLAEWGRRNGVALSHPRVLPDPPDPTGEPDGSAHFPAYKATRDAWSKAKFKAEFPKAAAYRHTLREEAEALRAVLTAARRDRDAGKIKTLHPALTNLDALDRDGLLDAHILLARPDDGIAQDYPPYRAAHRDELRRYLRKYVAPLKAAEGGGPKTARRDEARPRRGG